MAVATIGPLFGLAEVVNLGRYLGWADEVPKFLDGLDQHVESRFTGAYVGENEVIDLSPAYYESIGDDRVVRALVQARASARVIRVATVGLLGGAVLTIAVAVFATGLALFGLALRSDPVGPTVVASLLCVALLFIVLQVVGEVRLRLVVRREGFDFPIAS
jgi:hypothetical protein